MDKNKVTKIFEVFQKANPHPETELEYTNEFTLLVAVVLSAQATDKGVNKATPALFAIADTPQKMAALGEEKIRDYVKTIGLYRGKAKNIFLLSNMLIEKFGGKVPQTTEELEQLPGVGRKTANVVLNCAFGKPTMAVDTHVFRVANRIGLTKSKNPLQTEEQLLKTIPEKFMQHAHHWLILHGRYICVARKPKCRECPIVKLCEFSEKNL